jgi:type I restriction enzyme, S subunit
MKNKYRKVKLGDVANFQTGKLNSNAAKKDGIYPFFTCSPETFRIDYYVFDADAILLAGNNANGVFPIKRFTGKFNAYQRTYVITIKDKEKIDINYLFYLLGKSLNFLQNTSQGSTTKFLTLSILKNLELLLPPLSGQHRIANILSSFDNKIELLRKENNTLEDIAQNIFKEWFVKYNFPNKDGKPYRDNNGKMIDSELELIPEGWRIYKLSDLVKINKRGITPKYTDNHDMMVINQKCIRDNIIDYSQVSWHDTSKKYDSELELEFMDTLINSMGVGTLGRISPFFGKEKALPHSCVTLIRTNNSVLGKCTLYCYVKSLEKTITDMGEGSTGQTSLNNNLLAEFKIALEKNNAENIENLLLPIFSNIQKNCSEISISTKIRNILLNKLFK